MAMPRPRLANRLLFALMQLFLALFLLVKFLF